MNPEHKKIEETFEKVTKLMESYQDAHPTPPDRKLLDFFEILTPENRKELATILYELSNGSPRRFFALIHGAYKTYVRDKGSRHKKSEMKKLE